MGAHKPDWSELNTELLTSIASLLETRVDLCRFRVVCRSWRSSSYIPCHNLPYLSPIFPRIFSSAPIPIAESIIVANSTFLIQPRDPKSNPNHKPWLITVEELNPGTLVLRNPLTDGVVKDFSRVFNLSNCNVIQIRRDYNMRCGEGLPFELYSRRYNWLPNGMKVVLFFNPVSASVDDCFVLALVNGDILYARMNDENNHGYLYSKFYHLFDDIVNYKGSIWAIDGKGRPYVISYSDNLKLQLFSNEGVCMGDADGDTKKRLVESDDGLYLIDRVNYDEVIKFRVYKLNEKEFRWNEIKSLGDKILFVLTDCCFFRSSSDFPGCGRNCIYFPKGHFPAYLNTSTPLKFPDKIYFKGAPKELQVGVFHLDDGESSLVSSYPGYSDILWPPPNWLFPVGAPKELQVGVFHLDDGESSLVSSYPGYSDILWPPPNWSSF
ncbi:F-box protein SKIP23 [Bienertia sinuspersici]